MATLLSSMLSPVMAACTGTGKAISCHAAAMAADHCDRPMHQHHHHGAAPPDSKAAFSAGDDQAKCPMECCMAGHPTTSAVVSANSFLPPLAVNDREIHFASVTFTIAGFSSHTDRGPPRA
ncbi:MAG TPA: hypothetical protein VH024_14205 [Candidatus Angelobacter sp.]|nr:hypothetical protein [Candidatus Angelobacter sp.]